MKMIYILLPLIVSLVSCNGNDNMKKEFYPNGQLKFRAMTDETDVWDGLYEEYYETGEIKVKAYYKSGLLTDTIFTYYKNGKLESKGIQKNNTPLGWWSYYDLKGRLREKREILIIDMNPFLNQVIRYDSIGQVDYKNSSFFELRINDTLDIGGNMGEVFYFHDTLGYQKRYIRIILDNRYSENLVKKDTFVSEQNKNWFGIYRYKGGSDTVVGIIEGQLIFTNGRTPPENIVRTRTKYFKKPIYIKEGVDKP